MTFEALSRVMSTVLGIIVPHKVRTSVSECYGTLREDQDTERMERVTKEPRWMSCQAVATPGTLALVLRGRFQHGASGTSVLYLASTLTV